MFVEDRRKTSFYRLVVGYFGGGMRAESADVIESALKSNCAYPFVNRLPTNNAVSGFASYSKANSELMLLRAAALIYVAMVFTSVF